MKVKKEVKQNIDVNKTKLQKNSKVMNAPKENSNLTKFQEFKVYFLEFIHKTFY